MKYQFVIKGWWSHGGVETFCRNLNAASQESDFGEYLFSIYGEVPAEAPKDIDLTCYATGRLGLLTCLRSILNNKPDWVVINQPFSLIIAPFIKLFTNSRIVFVIHIDFDKFGHNLFYKLGFRLISDWFVDLILSMTKENQNKLADSGIRTQVRQFYPPLVRDEELAGREEFQKNYDIVFFGRMVEQKDPHFFLDVMEIVLQELPDTKILMIGSGDLDAEIDERLKADNFSRVTKLPAMDQRRLRSFVQHSKIFAMTSRYEGLGFVVIEAINWGARVVAADIPVGPRELLSKEEDLLVRDRKIFAKRLVYLLNNWSNQSKDDQLHVLSRFSFKRSMFEFEEILKMDKLK